jgi:isovaleryl-CoA dehydrogenase
MSEPNAGSDVVSMRTKAVKKGDKWILNGSKCWFVFSHGFRVRAYGRITNAPLSSTFLIYAKTGTEGPASKGLTAFIVERSSKGFEVGEHLDKFGVSLFCLRSAGADGRCEDLLLQSYSLIMSRYPMVR